jgi:hypothetical protein
MVGIGLVDPIIRSEGNQNGIRELRQARIPTCLFEGFEDLVEVFFGCLDLWQDCKQAGNRFAGDFYIVCPVANIRFGNSFVVSPSPVSLQVAFPLA